VSRSSKKRTVHYEFATLILECARRGHEAARVYRQPDGRTLVAQRDATLHQAGERLRLQCPTCLTEGHQTDLQMSWAKLDAALTEELADTTSRARKLTIG
jgi:hypothetical protein